MENIPVPEDITSIEEPTVVEDIPVTEDITQVEEPTVVEDIPVTEDITPIEEPTVVENNVSEYKADESNNFTLDYNALYNITPQSDNYSNALDGEKKYSEQEIDEPDNEMIAQPPSFEIEEPDEVAEEVIEEVEEEPQDLVSIDIDEPDVLPVGKVNPEEFYDENAVVVDAVDDMYSQKDDIYYKLETMPNEDNNKNTDKDLSKRESKPETKKIENLDRQMPVREPMQVRPQNRGPVPNGRPNLQRGPMPNGRVVQSRPNLSVQNRGPVSSMGPVQPRPMPNRQVNGRPPVRPVQGYNPNMGQPPRTRSKYINDESDKYTLPKSAPAYVQKPTDPRLVANPMSIFGANTSGVRPTANQAMNNPNYQNGVQQPRQNTIQGRRPVPGAQNRGPVPNRGPVQPRPIPNRQVNGRPPQDKPVMCPNCGFIVKPGQAVCVCGYKVR